MILVGILAVGTNNGAVRVFKIEKQKPMETESTETSDTSPAKPTFTMSQGTEIWAKDLLRIDYFDFVTTPAEERNILKSLSVDLLFVKHPTHICSCPITICNEDIACQDVDHITIPEGPIVGMSVSPITVTCHTSMV